jgi:hypothetical protein
VKRIIQVIVFAAVCVALVLAQQPTPEPTPEPATFKVEAFDDPQDLEKSLNRWAKSDLRVLEHYPHGDKEWYVVTNDLSVEE